MAVTEAIALALRGAISPQVALSRLLLGGADAAGIAAMVAAARPTPPTPAWQALAALLDGRAAELDRLAGELRVTGSDHTAMGGVAGIAAFFDRAVAHSPEAGVALYSLGDPAILEAATAEIIGWLHAERLLPPDAAVLDLGCGIGRIAAALAPGRSVLGLDVSPGMVAEARRRHADVPGLRFAVADGSAVPPGPYDLALLVDSMPYILQAGLADAVMQTLAGELRPGGAVAVLNLSYGRTEAADRADAVRWAGRHGWSLAVSRPFALWDGTAFVLRAQPAF